MSRIQRERLKKVFDELSKLYPDWRFGQLIANVSTWARGPAVESVWDVEDDELIKAAEEHLQNQSPKSASNRRKKAS